MKGHMRKTSTGSALPKSFSAASLSSGILHRTGPRAASTSALYQKLWAPTSGRAPPPRRACVTASTAMRLPRAARTCSFIRERLEIRAPAARLSPSAQNVALLKCHCSEARSRFATRCSVLRLATRRWTATRRIAAGRKSRRQPSCWTRYFTFAAPVVRGEVWNVTEAPPQ